mgnify:FL=1
MVKKKKIISNLLIIMIGIVIPINIYANSYIWSSMQDLAINTSANISEEYTNDMTNPLNLDCGSAILIEQTTGKVLYSYKSHEQLKPASVTKVMSILLIMEAINSGKINYDTQIPCSENASSMGGSQIWLDQTETLTVDEMLKAICVVSANDCVMAMAEYIAGSEEGFVKMMNDKAKELGMNDTTFKNCHGIDEDGHVTSSYDISLMSRELLNKYPEVKKYTTIWNDSLRDGKSELVNTNKLVRNYNGCTGLKTGSTSQALFNLSASATRDGLSLIAVIMKAPTSVIRFKNASSLLDYGFSNFEFTSLGKKGDVVQSVSIEKGSVKNIDVTFKEDTGLLITKGNNINVDKKIILDNANLPIKKGDVIGKVEFILDNEIVATTELVSENNVDKINIFSMNQYVLSNWFKLLR